MCGLSYIDKMYAKMVLPTRVERVSRANLALAVYKAAALPLSYGSKIGRPCRNRTDISALKRRDSVPLS